MENIQIANLKAKLIWEDRSDLIIEAQEIVNDNTDYSEMSKDEVIDLIIKNIQEGK